MAVLFTYDIEGSSEDNTRGYIRSLFERFGWQRVGNSAFHYQAPQTEGEALAMEDWLNYVVPPLMLFRAYVLHRGITVTRYTLHANSQSLFDDPNNIGSAPQSLGQDDLFTPSSHQFGERNLISWLADVEDACPYDA